MPWRPARVAIEDAEQNCRPRGIAGFFAIGNGVCGLCGTGLGKRYTRPERKEHEQGLTHRDNHAAYLEAFGYALQDRLERQRKENKIRRADMGRSIARDPIALAALFNELKIVYGVTEWINEADCEKLKAAIFDASTNSRRSGVVVKALQELKERVRARLLEKAATSALTNDSQSAHLVASLCKPCL
jgi:hypothetical protein